MIFGETVPGAIEKVVDEMKSELPFVEVKQYTFLTHSLIGGDATENSCDSDFHLSVHAPPPACQVTVPSRA